LKPIAGAARGNGIVCPDYDKVSRDGNGPAPKRVRRIPFTIAALIVVAAIVLGSIAIYSVYYTHDDSPFTADFTCWSEPCLLPFYVVPGEEPAGVTVMVKGYIYNHEPEDVAAMVHLEVFNGDSWHEYSVYAGIVPGGGSKLFGWSENYESGDVDKVVVKYTVSRA